MSIDNGQFSRILDATSHFPTNRYVEFMETMGNDAPLIWLADKRGYVLDDLSCRATPADWARRAVAALKDHAGDRIVAEANNGGDLVSTVIGAVDSLAPVTLVHAARGKRTRAEPVAALYEQGRVSHIRPMPEL